MTIILVCGVDLYLNLISWSIEHVHTSLDGFDLSNEDIFNVCWYLNICFNNF